MFYFCFLYLVHVRCSYIRWAHESLRRPDVMVSRTSYISRPMSSCIANFTNSGVVGSLTPWFSETKTRRLVFLARLSMKYWKSQHSIFETCLQCIGGAGLLQNMQSDCELTAKKRKHSWTYCPSRWSPAVENSHIHPRALSFRKPSYVGLHARSNLLPGCEVSSTTIDLWEIVSSWNSTHILL